MNPSVKVTLVSSFAHQIDSLRKFQIGGVHELPHITITFPVEDHPRDAVVKILNEAHTLDNLLVIQGVKQLELVRKWLRRRID